MDYDSLMKKFASQGLDFSPAMQEVVSKVRAVGLHKTAGKLHGVDEMTFKTAAQILGDALLQHHMKHQKIASGLRALSALTASGDVKPLQQKQANMFRMMGGGVQKMIPEAAQGGAQQAGSMAGRSLPRAGGGQQGMFSGMPAAQAGEASGVALKTQAGIPGASDDVFAQAAAAQGPSPFSGKVEGSFPADSGPFQPGPGGLQSPQMAMKYFK